MRLNTYFTVAVSTLVLFAVAACNSAGSGSNSVPTTATVNAAYEHNAERTDKRTAILGSLKLELIDEDGQCSLIHNKSVTKLEIPAGCDFNRNQDGSLRIYPDSHYPEKNGSEGEKIFLVEHSITLKDSKDCDTKLRAVKTTKKDAASTFELSAVMENIATCVPNEWDEINFIGAFPRNK